MSSLWGPGDYASVSLYFIAVSSIAIHFARKQNAVGASSSSSSGRTPSRTESYFLAGHSVPFWAVGASLFSANIGAEHFVALAGSAASTGIATAWYEWGAMPCLLILGGYFLPVYLNARVDTMPEWVEKRFSTYCRNFLVVFSLIIYLVTKIAATLYAGQLIITEVSDFNSIEAIIILIIGTAIYTILGGLTAVVYTEALQTCVLAIGGLTLLALSLIKVGGWEGVHTLLSDDVDPLYFHIFRPASDPDFPWPGLIFGFYFVALWFWATDQVIVQRALAARNIEHGQAGCVVASFLKLLPGFIMVIPGIIGRALYVQEGIVVPEGDTSLYDRVYPWLVMNVMPVNLRGIVISAMLSALMGHLAAVFNSCATIFAENIYLPNRPMATQDQQVWVGRGTIVVIAILSMLWLPVIPHFGSQLFFYVQEPPAFVAPPIFAMFLWGVTFPHVTAESVEWAISIGVGFGSLRFIAELIEGYISENIPVISQIASIQFLEFALTNFLLSSALIFLISFFRPGNREWDKESSRLLWRQGLYWELQGEPKTDVDSMETSASSSSPKKSTSKSIEEGGPSTSQQESIEMPLGPENDEIVNLQETRVFRKQLINIGGLVAFICFLTVVFIFR